MRVKLDRTKLLGLIAESGLSQNHWAIKLGLSRGHFSDLVNGKHPYPSVKTQQRFLDGFGVKFEDLFEEEDEAPGLVEKGLANFQAALADRYLIDSEIGRGGMGVVYLARELKHGRRVAIKVLSPEVVSGVGASEFLKEIRHTARLEHHNILTLLDSGNAAGQPYYVIPYARSGSLRTLLDEKSRLTVDETVSVIKGVSAGLEYAHRQRVMHCDVKPENILLSDDHPYVADFGIARVIHAETRAWGKRNGIDSSAGTPAYVSPEQASGDSEIDGRTDVYSLACVAYELLAGRPPFEGRTTLETVSRRFTSETPDVRELAPHVPESVAQAIREAMEVDLDRRTLRVGLFSEALEKASLGPGSVWSRVTERLMRLGDGIGRLVAPKTSGYSAFAGFFNFVGGFVRDLRFAWRFLRRAPSHVLLVALTLALGIGANAAIFSIVSSLLLRPLPFPDAANLVMLRERGEQGRTMWPSYPNFLDWRDQATGFDGMVAVTFRSRMTLIANGAATKAPVAGVSPDFFGVVGVPLAVGRPITPEENRPGGPPVVVISHRLWETFLGAPSELGRVTITIGNDVAEVVGVMPPGFEMLDQVDLWYPLEQSIPWNARGAHVVRVVGRVNAGTSAAAAAAELDGIARLLKDRYGDDTEAVGVAVMSLKEWVVGDTRKPLLLLFGAAGVLLLIACSNVASSLMARGAARSREFAIRTSLGAGRSRLIRQLTSESLVLAVLGGVGGLALAWVLIRAASVFGPALPQSNPLTLDIRVGLFAASISLLSAAVFGLFPAFQLVDSRLAESLRVSAHSTGAAKKWIWNGLIGAQTALAIVLLAGAGLLARSFASILDEDTGYDAIGVLSVEISVPSSRYPGVAGITSAYDGILAQVRAVPGVASAGVVSMLPMWGSGSFVGPFSFHDGRSEEREEISAHYRLADERYFDTMRIPLISGRLFNSGDGPDSDHVVVINKSMADRYWPDADPIGQQISLPGMDPYRGTPLTIIGVVGEARQWNVPAGSHRVYYINYRQRPAIARAMVVVARSTAEPGRLVPPIRSALERFDPNIPAEFSTISDGITRSVADRRFTAFVFGAFAIASLFLVAAGAYGVLSFSVARRTKEMGIRLALGAKAGQITFTVVREMVLVLGIGLAVGLAMAFGVTRLLRSQLFGVTPLDPVTFAGAISLILAVGMAACYLPARRSTRVDPLVAIREE